ncbi:hypothetical protein B0T20DRAFT_54958 [Sordaria brevicollis]|uniref:Uncharacterized protein n=1 Tax=Sordaria brevicollis TaxID=83679 RepID=A0AAE0U655_SORBR|nr:hypothetical protein B0T20DRAFT_54958 [Sordaria brevicollis]
MHLPTLLTTLTTLGLATLASAAAVDTTTSVPTGCQSSGPSNTCSASSASVSTTNTDADKPQTLKEYIHSLEAKHAANNSTSTSTTGSEARNAQAHVSGLKAYEVPMCCMNGCEFCSSKICGPGSYCIDMPFYSCCSTIILWDTEKDEMLDAFTTEGEFASLFN